MAIAGPRLKSIVKIIISVYLADALSGQVELTRTPHVEMTGRATRFCSPGTPAQNYGDEIRGFFTRRAKRLMNLNPCESLTIPPRPESSSTKYFVSFHRC